MDTFINYITVLLKRKIYCIWYKVVENKSTIVELWIEQNPAEKKIDLEQETQKIAHFYLSQGVNGLNIFSRR